MIEIYQQKMAVVLTVAIQALVFGGLIACIVVGTQDRPSPVVSPAGGTGSLDYRPESASPAAYPIFGHRPEAMPVSTSPGTGEELISFRV
ncbi:MAG: Uncharacterized protein XD82_0746 [Methanoculleus marisnigri]|uniref:Uncharacterized protein n=1 Tax=Methanoculleus marisnigri TaxID=2198 RepID=A0A101GPH3_9EURY|nr:hypothetical protein [Methanoculleus marisnigri]KUK62255.1 MAG: Uncharacterized protein XD82_0746 [Methanoculleus marisnigri]